MQKMLQGKNGSTIDGKSVVNVKTITTIMNVVNVNFATKSSGRALLKGYTLCEYKMYDVTMNGTQLPKH